MTIILPSKEPEYLSIGDAAKMLHVSTQTLRDWTDQDRLDAYMTSGGTRKYLLREVKVLQHELQGRSEFFIKDTCLYLFADGSFGTHFDPNDKNCNKPVARKMSLREHNWGEKFSTRDDTFADLVDNSQAGYDLGKGSLYTYANEGAIEMPVIAYAWTLEEAEKTFSEAINEAKNWLTSNCVPKFTKVDWEVTGQTAHAAY